MHCVTVNDQQLCNIKDFFPYYSPVLYPCNLVTEPSKLDEKQNRNNLTIHPNPTKDFFILNMPDYNQAKRKIEILNLLGQCVQKLSVTHSQQKINVEHLPAGIYFVRVVDVNGTSYSAKLLITK